MIRKLIVAINQRSETLLSPLNLDGPIDQRLIVVEIQITREITQLDNKQS